MTENDNSPIYIILDRHPESVGNEGGSEVYAKLGDPNVGITDLGILQARAEADFMMMYFEREGIQKMPQIWAGDYLRVRQGMNIKLQRIHEINPGFIDFKQIIHADDMLTERNFGDLAYAKYLMDTVFKDNPVAQQAIIADMQKGAAVYKGVPHSARPAHGESKKDMGVFARAWRESLERDIEGGARVHWVMGHGDVDKAIIAKQFHWHGQDIWGRIPKIGNCDVIVIKGKNGDWTVQKVYDGEQMKPMFDISPIYRGKPNRVGDLPFASEGLNIN
jgi:broad specificity phosphatase PhoE